MTTTIDKIAEVIEAETSRYLAQCYELYELPETFHTEGFYKRESSLYYQIRGEQPETKG